LKLAAIWEFIAGDSRRAPLAAGLALLVAFLLIRTTALGGAAIGGIFAVIIALGLAASVFERS
jgi:hypothetical protein